MPVQWQKIDVPMGRGLDTKSGPLTVAPGSSTVDINTEFTKTGQRRKRKGFNAQLGQVALAQRLLVHNKHLLAHGGGNLLDYSPAAGGFESIAALRTVPCRPQVVRNNNVSITATDSFSLSGYTLTIWNDSSGISARITDDVTGAVVASKTDMFSQSTVIKAWGMLHAGQPFFYVLAGGVAWRWRGDTQAWDGAATTLVTGIGTITAIAVCAHGGNFTVFWAATTSIAIEEYQWDFTFVGGNLAGGAALAGSPACISLDAGGTFYYCGYNKASDGQLHGRTVNASTFAVIIDTAITALGAAGHVTCAIVPGSTNTAYLYDLATYVGTTQAQVLAQAFSSSAFGVATTEFTLFRSVSLASDAGANSGLIGVNQLYFLVQYRSAATNSISGVNFSASLQNAATFVVTYGGDIVGRVFRGQSIVQTNTSSVSKDAQSALVFGLLTLGFSDSTTAQSATTYGAAALLRVDNFGEKARGVSALQDYFAVGGSPSVFDGASVVEAGFHLFPECVVAGIASSYAKLGLFETNVNVTGIAGGTATRANLTSYPLGTRITGKSTGMPAGVAWGHVYVAVTAGITGAASPGGWSITGHLVTDGTVIWQDAGLEAPQKAWAAGLTPAQMALGTVITPALGNGFIYVVIAVGGGNTATDPAAGAGWPTGIGASTGVLADGYNYTCVGQPKQLTSGKAYQYVFTYEWVDDQGLLHISAPSPVFTTPALSGDGTNADVLLVVTTLRMTKKGNVRIAVHRTVGDGSIAYKIALLQNDPTVDAIAFIDGVSDNQAQQGLKLYCGDLGIGQFPNVPPPSCSTAAVWNGRVVTNSLESPYTIWPSKSVQLDSVYSDVPAWADQLPEQVDASFGTVNVLVEMDGKLVVFQDRRISFLLGDGPDNAGGGASFQAPQPIAADVGCTNPDSTVLTAAGILFQSAKGIYLLTRGGDTQFIGAPLLDMGLGTVVAAVSVPATNQVLFLDDAFNLFVFDIFAGQWSMWTVNTTGDGFLSIVGWNGALVGMDDGLGKVLKQTGTYGDYGSAPYGTTVTLGPLTPAQAGALPFMRIRSATLQLGLDSTTGFTISVLEDYATAPTYSAAAISLASGQRAAQVLLRNQKLKSIGLKIQETTLGDGVIFEGLVLEIGMEQGVAPVAKAQRTS